MQVFNGLITRDMIDLNGHLHHSHYLSFLEEARWAQLTQKASERDLLLKETGAGYVILEMKLRFRKELLVGDTFEIRTHSAPTKHPKVHTTEQVISVKNADVLRADIKFGLLDLKTRKLIVPPMKWKLALGF